MKKILLVALFLVLSFSITTKSSRDPKYKQYIQLRNGQSWAKVILKMAELRQEAGGAIDDLYQAVQDVITDLTTKIARSKEEFAKRTTEHEADVLRLGNSIDSFNLKISETEEFLQNVLYVQKSELEAAIAQHTSEIEENEKYMEDEGKKRELETAKFNERITEHQELIEAMEECLTLLGELQESGGELSLSQINYLQDNFAKIQKGLKNSEDVTITQTLAQLATTEFADSEAVSSVVKLINEVKNNLIASIAKEQEEEENSQKLYEADMDKTKATINQLIIDRTDSQAQLDQTVESIAANEEILAQAKQDLADAEQELEDENKAYEDATNNFNALQEQLNKELNSCNEALNILESAEFADYIVQRTDQNVVVDQPHGLQDFDPTVEEAAI